jgi:putative copper resistance protein D
MNLLDGGIIMARAVHFASTAMVAGPLIFQVTISDGILHVSPKLGQAMRRFTLRIVWSALPVVMISVMLWVLLLATSIGGLSFGDTISTGVLQTVIDETLFGSVSEIRLLLLAVLAAFLFFGQIPVFRWPALLAAIGLMASIAWTGHAASTVASLGWLHLTSDVLHLLAAAAWIGGLPSYVWLLVTARRGNDDLSMAVIQRMTDRFSLVGILSVAALIVSGVVNAWLVVRSVQALVTSDYGHLLILKVILFIALLAFAAVNRFVLTPQLAICGDRFLLEPIRRLTRNSLIELVLGGMVFAVVGALGTLHPVSAL